VQAWKCCATPTVRAAGPARG